ncbi:MAG: beta-galactosidase [Candidatus Sulfopaludibacter sp.]|nr:beta-galactosidase [Candidatus Sulfopaludibacter sp.]
MRACARVGLLLAFAAAASPVPSDPPVEYIQAVEFPYYLCPQTLWERELVWLKNLGVHTVEFSVPWNWHQLPQGGFDLTGRTSPRRDLVGFIRLLRRLGMRAWVRPLPPVAGWPNHGVPTGAADAGAQRAWLKALESVLTTQTASHGGPVAWVEGGALSIDAARPPTPVVVIPADDPNALRRSRAAIAGTRGALLWTGLEESLYPAGWEANAGSLLQKGAVDIGGTDRRDAAALSRDAALLRNWSPLLPGFQPVAMPKPAAGKLPDGVSAVELASSAASAISITNQGARTFYDELRAVEAVSKHVIAIPKVTVGPGESLWLPLNVSLGPKGLCRECTNFSAVERIVYATAELLSIEYENGILAMEFAAPADAEAILQLERQPVGPYLAAGKPADFDWDDKLFRARLPIPASRAAGHRVRIGIAMEAPETSAFFNDAKRLIVGRKNVVSTSYSSPELAARSRLRLPEGYTAAATPQPEGAIDYEIAVPADAVHGDFANLALEADGMPLGRARLELFRPATIRIAQAIRLHFGTRAELEPDPPVATIDPRGGSNLDVIIRNNWPGIQTFRLEAAGEGLDFFPAKQEISIGATDERRYLLRVIATPGITGLRNWHLKVTGAATVDLPMRVVLLPRGRTVVWSADLDGDGSPEWVLESQKARAVFSSEDEGRWMEFTSKETGANFLPDRGAFAAAGPVQARAVGERLEISGKGWTRAISLIDNALTIEQTSPLPADNLTAQKQGNLTLSVEHPSPTRAVYTLK